MKMKKIVCFLVLLFLVSQLQAQEHVEICGIKWAKGNFYYYKGTYGINDEPGWQFNLSRQRDESVDHFNWGWTTPSYTSVDYLRLDGENICGTKYDIVTVRMGKNWRLPTYAEFEKLLNEATRESGVYYYTTGSGDKVAAYGMLFTNPEKGKKRKIIKSKIGKTRVFNKEEIEKGVFLPFGGYRDSNSQLIRSTSKINNKYIPHFHGYYWTGESVGTSPFFLALNYTSPQHSELRSGLSFGSVYSGYNETPIEGNLGFYIRPVFTE